MRKFLSTTFLLALLLISVKGFGQDFNTRFQDAYKLSTEKKFDEALAKFNVLLKESPNYSGVHVQISWIYIFKGDLAKANAFAQNAYDLYQDDMGANAVKAYALLAGNQRDEGIRFLNQCMWLDPDGNNLSSLQKDLDEMIGANINTALMKEAKAYIATAYPARNKTFLQIFAAMRQGDQELGAKKFSLAKAQYDKAIALFANAPAEYKFLKARVAAWAAEGFLNFSNDFDLPYAIQALEEAKLHGPKVSSSVKLGSAFIIMETYLRKSDFEKGIAIANTYSNEVTKAPLYANYKANFLYSWLKLLQSSQQENQNAWKLAIPVAQQLLSVKNTTYDHYYQAVGNNLLGSAYSQSGLPIDKQRSQTHVETAMRIAKEHGMDDLVLDFEGNMALMYWLKKDYDKAKDLYIQNANKQKAKGNLGVAEVSYNNAGAMLYNLNRFAEAAPVLQQAVNITEEIRSKLKGREKILFMQKNVSAYDFMIAAYARSGNGREVFNTQNKDRARMLNETLAKKGSGQSITPEAFQALLKPDEAALFYSQMEAGTFIINVVTKESIKPLYLEDFQRWVNIKKQYLDRIHAADGKAKGYKPANEIFTENGITYKVNNLSSLISRSDMDEIMELTRECLQDVEGKIPVEITRQLLSAYYQSLIAPTLPLISAKKRLLIFSDGILNFLPFEALINSSGRYLIQDFDVKYCQSADVYSNIMKRNYTQQRKAFFGMGGAIYEDMSEKADGLRSAEQLVNLQEIAEQNIFGNKSQREVYAALFGSKKMTYLAGTLKEIQNLSAIFPDRDVFYGMDMTENKIKQLSVSGQLKNYKIIHLATHGFAVPSIPELSGVAMCILNKMQGNEDGYLTAPEIAKLQFNADLAVLSACQTGLGKIYGGEGVSGLTGSLLEAGANQALVTLWNVSDAGTMYYMTGLYNLVTKEGKGYAEASSIMKRKFINGDYGELYKKFNFWAPYISYGR